MPTHRAGGVLQGADGQGPRHGLCCRRHPNFAGISQKRQGCVVQLQSNVFLETRIDFDKLCLPLQEKLSWVWERTWSGRQPAWPEWTPPWLCPPEESSSCASSVSHHWSIRLVVELRSSDTRKDLLATNLGDWKTEIRCGDFARTCLAVRRWWKREGNFF